ncbi:NADP-dependent oxidoreductase [Larkinella sp. VNQ87]|uniref:NADP-dependent oxidoreductase n=1 Tax=Larkinella sp. VNQ87 TaxID=3400921 RepID=UPI003BFF4069
MKAIILNGFGGVDQLTYTELPTPAIQDHEVLIRVKAISLNPVDVKTRSGKGVAGRLKDVQPIILGWDVSGIVTEVGLAVTAFKPGDEVFGMVNFPGHGQAYAEYVAAPASHLTLKPAHISHEAVAATTLAALTAWQALKPHLELISGQKVLIHAAAGGVGHFAVQLAHYWGHYVIGTASAQNREFVLELGADEHLDYKAQSLPEAVSDVDLVLDSLGGENIDLSLPVIKPGGIIISIPSGKNDQVTEKAAAKGVNGYPFMVQSNGDDMKALADLLDKGVLVPRIFKTFPFEQMADAHLQVETGKTAGKVIVTL